MRKALVLSFTSLLFAGAFSFSEAAIIVQQTVKTDLQPVSGSAVVGECIGLGSLYSTLSITQFSFWVESNNAGANFIGALREADASATGEACSGTVVQSANVFGVDDVPGGALLTFDITDYLVDATKKYAITVAKTSGGNQTFVYGSSGDTIGNGMYWVGGNGSTSGDPVLQDAYFVLEGQFGTTTDSATTSSRIVEQVQPTNGATTPSTDVTFEYTWFNNPTDGAFDFVQTEISDVTQGYQYVPIQFPVLLSGFSTTTHGKTLTQGHLHLWRACFLNSISGLKRCSGYQSFNVVSPSASSSFPILPDVDEANASSTLQGSIWNFLNAYSLLQTKLPFAYFFQIADLMNELQATSTTAIQPVVFDYGSLDISTTTKNSLPSTWEAFSTTTVTQYIPPLVLSTWRLLMSAVLWFGFAMYAYHTVPKVFTGNSHAV